jgi:hypothetical protein
MSAPSRLLWLLVLAAGLSGCSASVPAAPGDGDPPPAKGNGSTARPKAAGPLRVGLNLAAVQDWSREWAFVDAFKGARAWSAEGGGDLAFDKAGNPLPAPGKPAWTLVLRELEGHYPPGKYVATWKGTGEVDVSRYDVTQVVAKAKNRTVFEVKPGQEGVQIDLLASKATDPVRDFRIWMPGFENAKSPFHPLFLERLKPAKVVRFMDWQRTNNSTLGKWADRPKPEDATYATDRGVPVEVMVALANTAKVDPWFCMPHRADDDFVREFAKLVKAKLDPARTVYVEYSNEVWNWMFDQTKWAQEQGKARKLGEPDHARFYAERSVEVMKIWEEEFGRERLVRVLASQNDVPWLSEQILTWKKAHEHADALSVAPYFGHETGDPKAAAATLKLTAAQLLDGMEKEIDGPNRDAVRQQAVLAGKFGLRLIAYEGGQHLVGHSGAENNEELAKLFQTANRDPRMYSLYRKHLKHWADAGGDLYVFYNYAMAPSKWGSWGLLEYQDQPIAQAHKYRAFVDVGNGR